MLLKELPITAKVIEDTFKANNWRIQPFGLIGIRSEVYDTNTFNDLIGYHQYLGTPKAAIFLVEGTTDPGFEPLKTPPAKGVAVMKSGFYFNLYQVGFHKGNPNHPCFKQIHDALFYRVKAGTGKIVWDETTLVKDTIGANIHGTSPEAVPIQVNNYSEACQVVLRWKSLMAMLTVARQSKLNQYDYALIQQKQLIL